MESAGDNGKIEIMCEDNALFTEITLHDSGPGFEKEDLFCLFDRFYRGKNAGAVGYGIGLALCKTIITRQAMNKKSCRIFVRKYFEKHRLQAVETEEEITWLPVRL